MRISKAVRFLIYASILIGIALLAIIFLFSPNLPSNLPKNLIVLAKDPDGTVGQVGVSTNGGHQVLTKALQATGASSAAEPPHPPFTLSRKEVNEIFGDVIKGMPTLPTSFTLNFDPNVSILTSSKVQIDQIVAEVHKRPVWDMTIYAYASGVGNPAINRVAALLRGRAVSDALASLGLDMKKVSIQTLVAPGAVVRMPDGRTIPNNRRIEVAIR